MEQAYCTAVFWRGGEKIDLNGRKPDAVRCLSVTGERKVNLSFLRDYPNLEELTLMEKCEGVEVLSGLKQLHTLSLWLSAPVSWDNVSLPGLRVLHLRGEKNGDITPLLTSITYLHLEEMLFKKKIVFTEGMNETLCSFDEIPWFSCCGVPYDKPSYYPYLQEKDPKRAEKLLLHTKNYSGTVCLTNLFKEGICRADTFILQTAGWKFYQNEFMPCVEASWRTYEKRALKANGLDLNSVEKRFLRDYGFPDSIDLQLCRMVQYLLVEQYFLERFPQFPLFFSRIIDIYKDGHIVLGWSGRFASHETNLENENGVPILPTDGSLIIW